MAEPMARVECIEMREPPNPPRRWCLVRVEELLTEFPWLWSNELARATRMPASQAEALLTLEQRSLLPNLPTEPPQVPMFLRALYGEEAPPVPTLRTPVAEPEATEPSVPIDRRVPSKRVQRIYSAADAEARWQEEHEA